MDRKGLNAFADKNDIRTITLKINGGLNGFESAGHSSTSFSHCFVTKTRPPSRPGGRGGPRHKWLQQTLNTLGAHPRLEIDGRFDTATRQAVGEFQMAASIQSTAFQAPSPLAAIKLSSCKPTVISA